MAWYWLLHGAAPAQADRSSAFGTQADAETWIGESWRDLRTSGVESVSLCEDGRTVYGPMSLEP